MIYKSVAETIGNTPLIEVSNIEKYLDLKATILVKLEAVNPAGSIKDRAARQMILDAEASGILKPGATIIEPTSGNTGIGLAAIAAAKGYKSIFIMPDTMSKERINIIKAYGAEIVLTPGALGMKGTIDKANELNKEIEGSWIAGQFENPSNPKAHYLTTAPEIWEATEGNVDIFVAGFGTGGTVSGIGKYLKEKNKDIKVVAMEPYDSPLLSQGKCGPHKLQGIGANFIPENLDQSLIDEVVTVTTEQAFSGAKLIATKEGVLVGITSGANLSAAIELAQREENYGKTIVTVLPDNGDRYYSTPLFTE